MKVIKVFSTLLISILFSISANAGETITFYHTDPAGTPIAISDQNGNKVWEADNKPFGEEHAITQTIENNRRFVGKEKDTETGLNYFGARYFSTTNGRFLAPDAIRAVDPYSGNTNLSILSDPQRLNTYAYSLNNPYRYIDPDGNWAEAIVFEGPSIIVGAHSLASNIKQGNWGAAIVDAGGIVADGVAAVAPGVPGGVGLGIKATRAANAARKVASPVYKTTKQATAAAKNLGFRRINETVHGQAIYKKGKRYITRDVDGHNGGAWKGARSVEDLRSKTTRVATYDKGLNVIGD